MPSGKEGGSRRKAGTQPKKAEAPAVTAKKASAAKKPAKKTATASAADIARRVAQMTAAPARAAGSAETVASEAVIAPENLLQLVAFSLGGEHYGFPIMRVQEILRARMVHVTPIPNAPSHVEGVMNLRGKVIPVIGLSRRLGMPEGDTGRAARIVVVEIGGRVSAVTVDSVSEVVSVDASLIEALPEMAATRRSEFVVGVSRADGRMVIVLDTDRVFATEDRSSSAGPVEGKREETSCA